MTLINPNLSEWKWVGLEQTIPMMYHTWVSVTSKCLLSWWCGGGRVIIVSALSLSLREKERLSDWEIARDRESLKTIKYQKHKKCIIPLVKLLTKNFKWQLKIRNTTFIWCWNSTPPTSLWCNFFVFKTTNLQMIRSQNMIWSFPEKTTWSAESSSLLLTDVLFSAELYSVTLKQLKMWAFLLFFLSYSMGKIKLVFQFVCYCVMCTNW